MRALCMQNVQIHAINLISTRLLLAVRPAMDDDEEEDNGPCEWFGVHHILLKRSFFFRLRGKSFSFIFSNFVAKSTLLATPLKASY